MSLNMLRKKYNAQLDALIYIYYQCVFVFNCSMGKLMTLEEKKKLINDYMSKCPFIEKYDIVVIDDEWARVELDIAFDSDK